MSNDIRGIVTLKVDGKDVPMRLTLGVLAATQRETNARTLAEVGTRIGGSDMVTLVALTRNCLNAAGGSYSEGDMLSFSADSHADHIDAIESLLDQSGLWASKSDSGGEGPAGKPKIPANVGSGKKSRK